MTRIAILSASPGAGKTTTAVALASYLGSFGARVLVVDCDPAGDATVALRSAHTLQLHQVIERGFPLDMCLASTARTRVDALAPTESLTRLNVAESDLRDLLQPIERRHSYTFFDCPAGAGTAVVTAVSAADEAIIVVSAEEESLFELPVYLNEVERLRARVNPRLRLRLLFTLNDGSRPALSTRTELKRRYAGVSLSTVIPTDAALFRIVEGDSPLDISSPGTRAYSDLATEIASRTAARRVA